MSLVLGKEGWMFTNVRCPSNTALPTFWWYRRDEEEEDVKEFVCVWRVPSYYPHQNFDLNHG
jgi:hypothetical protein